MQKGPGGKSSLLACPFQNWMLSLSLQAGKVPSANGVSLEFLVARVSLRSQQQTASWLHEAKEEF